MFVRHLEEAADFGAFEVEFHAVGFGVAEDGDEASGILDEAVHGPGGEGEGFAGLAAPEPDFDAILAIIEGGLLISAKLDREFQVSGSRFLGGRGQRRGRCPCEDGAGVGFGFGGTGVAAGFAGAGVCPSCWPKTPGALHNASISQKANVIFFISVLRERLVNAPATSLTR